MFDTATPESLGIPSRAISEFLSFCKRRGSYTHSMLFMRHGKIIAEGYHAPYDVNSLNRMYSQTKSFVSVAIGCLLDEGKISLDDKICDYFTDRIPHELPPYLAEQTIREMLTMTTSIYKEPVWFTAGDPDRVHLYFDKGDGVRPSGTVWRYDSAGSQVLSALVERLSGMSLLDYLRKRLFSYTGGFESAQMLKTPNGESWGDSAMLCTLRDMATFGNLVMHYGKHEKKQLVSEAYLREATSPLVCNDTSALYHVFHYGYGYQIWCTEQGGFAFVGMGDQLTVCLPEHDFLFTMTADNQGAPALRQLIISALFDIVVASMKPEALPECPEDYAALTQTLSHLSLRCMPYGKRSSFWEKICSKKFYAEPNPTGIKWVSLNVFEDEGVLTYENQSGEKCLDFGIGFNFRGRFPEPGYSDEVGTCPGAEDFRYRCATSLGFVEERKCLLRVQIIDRYLGNLSVTFAFKDENTVTVHMEKTAEHFLKEYEGEFTAHSL